MGSVDPSQHTFWTQRVRNSETGMVADSARGSVISPPYQRIVDVQSVVLDDRWDAVIVLGDFDDAPLPGVVGDAEIWGWLWKRINTPGNVAAQVSGNTVTLTWTNQHRGRSLDGTIIHRYQNGTRYLAVLAGAGDSTFVETVPTGLWRYELRHGQAAIDYQVDQNWWSDPVVRDVNVGVPPPVDHDPPTYVNCRGRFAAVIDCAWQNQVHSVPLEVLRDDAVVATLAAGTTSYSDSTVARNETYAYRLRHVENTHASTASAPATVMAQPVPPTLLSCGDHSPTSIQCYWDGWEPEAETEVYRSTSFKFSHLTTKPPGVTNHLDTGLTTGVMYWYMVRYKLGADVSDWSNVLAQDAGGNDPEGGNDR
jgi:hypothetical protein